MKREITLEERAKQQLSICCETLCERAVVERYIEELEKEKFSLYGEIADLQKYVAELEEAVQ